MITFHSRVQVLLYPNKCIRHGLAAHRALSQPQLASAIILDVSPVVGLAVNKTPAARTLTIFNTATPMRWFSKDIPLLLRTESERGLCELDHTIFIFSR